MLVTKMENLENLIKELCKYSNETQWIEFKHNNYDPKTIGEDISALANGATLEERNCAYFIWGIDDTSHKIVGTDYNLQTLKKGNQELENWLRTLLSYNADFSFQTVTIENKKVGVLIIQAATGTPVTFEKTEYIRVGSYTKKLKEFPALQSKLWFRLHNTVFETQIATSNLNSSEALQLLDFSAYFDLLGIPQPSTQEEIIHYLTEERILLLQDNGLYSVSNMGAMLFAKRLADFSRLSRKAVRVIQYHGTNRLEMLREEVGNKGYAIGFEGLIKYIEALLPSKELINGAIREKKTAYPILSIREAIANAIIHQDFSISGTGPTVEIFENRIEITNPGTPLVDIKRIIDNPPKSRNEKLAALMRRLRMCEELGTGWDKIVLKCEEYNLPAPRIDLYEENTRVTLFSHIPFPSLSAEDKLWACYLHACILYVQGEQLTNTSLRTRFSLEVSSSGSISRLIKDAVEKKLVKPLDPTTAPRYMRYIPSWA